jgi:hypothetical protein
MAKVGHCLTLFIVFFMFCLTPAGSAYGSSISEEFQFALDNMTQDLKPPLSRIGLLSLVTGFHYARVTLAPNGYESGEAFKGSFPELLNSLRGLLWTVNLTDIRAGIQNKDIHTMVSSYENNKAKYDGFVSSVKANERFLVFKNVPSELILRSRIYYSIILSGGDQNMLAFAKRFTHIWPFCDGQTKKK